jgi:alcohol dehydrogenase
MAHQLGGFYNLPHGVCNAILLPYVCDFNLIACPKRYRNIAVALGQDVTGLSDLDAGAKGIQAIRQLSELLGIPSGLAELGVREGDLKEMATNAKKDACQLTNPRTATLQQVVDIYMSAMGTHAVGAEDIRAVA